MTGAAFVKPGYSVAAIVAAGEQMGIDDDLTGWVRIIIERLSISVENAKKQAQACGNKNCSVDIYQGWLMQEIGKTREGEPDIRPSFFSMVGLTHSESNGHEVIWHPLNDAPDYSRKPKGHDW